MKKLAFITILVSLIGSCSPFTKEHYLAKFKGFIDDVTENGMNYSEDEWKRASEKYNLLSKDWFNKFKAELTLDEKMRVAGYRLKYNSVKTASEVGRLYQSFLKKDVDKLKKNIKNYIDNQMDDDLTRFQDEAKRVSKDLYMEIKRVIEEIKADQKD